MFLRRVHTGVAFNHTYLPCQQRLVVKPDQLIKRRGKLGLVHVDSDVAGIKEWVSAHMNKEIEVGPAKGKLTQFIVEPFVPHQQDEEFYIWLVRFPCTIHSNNKEFTLAPVV